MAFGRWLEGLLKKMPATTFWLHAVLVGGAGLIFFLVRPLLGKTLAEAGR